MVGGLLSGERELLPPWPLINAAMAKIITIRTINFKITDFIKPFAHDF